MWPFSYDAPATGEVVRNDLSSHDVVSYSIDGAFVIIVMVVILVYRWKRNTTRLRQLERNVQQRELNGVSSA